MGSSTEKNIVIIAGEASGDMHAAHLVDELKKLDPSLNFSGLGGPHMKQSGVELYKDLTQLALIGFVEVLKHYGEIKKIFNLILKKISEVKPKAVILVDYPGFNLRLAKKLHAQGIKVIYYISPQVWAWKQKRVHFIKEHIDKMLVIFQFEQDFYRRFGYAVDFVGHPLMDSIKIKTSREEYRSTHDFGEDNFVVGLLPGSRQKEIERHLPVMLETAQNLKQKYSNIQFILAKASTINQSIIEQHLAKAKVQVKIVSEDIYDAVHACDSCMVASGTATLETAIIGTPMVVIYKTSFLTWVLAKLFVKIPNIGLVNVVANKRIVPECVQYDATPEEIAIELEDIFTNKYRIEEIKKELTKVKESLGSGGASLNAARQVIEFISTY